jgi:hypothetical protein
MGKSKFHRRQKLPREHSDHPGTRKTRRWEGQLTGLEAAINKANRASRVALYRARKALHKSAGWDTLTKEEKDQREEEVVNANSRMKETKITQLQKEWHGIERDSEEEQMEDEEIEEEEIEEQLSDGREEVMDEDIPDEDSWTSSPAGRRDSTDPSPAPGDPEGNYVSSGEEAGSDEPEFDGYDDEPGEEGGIGEIYEEIVGSFEDVIKRLNERIRTGVIVPWEQIRSFDENADSSSYEDWDSHEGEEDNEDDEVDDGGDSDEK